MLAVAAGVALAVWNYRLRASLAEAQARLRGMRRDGDIRQNLQKICNARAAEIRRLQDALDRQRDARADLEDEIADLKVELFNETGRRIMAEKEDGARNLRLDQAERELTAARQRLRERDAAARQEAEQLRGTIRLQAAELARLEEALNPPAAPRRARRARTELLDQVTMDDILNGAREK